MESSNSNSHSDSDSDSNSNSNSAYYDRIVALADEARCAREAFEPLATPDEERAMEYLQTGVGPTVGLYIEARTADEPVRFSPDEMALLERAMNDWLALYARCYGVALDPEFTVREAAELLIDTHNITDTAQLLTKVPLCSGETSTND